ncbi:zinc finger, CCHC-type containing protein [Tanacetum coccineum]
MSSASSAVTYTSVYTDLEPGGVFWGADEEISDGGSPRVIVLGYDGLPTCEHRDLSSDNGNERPYVDNFWKLLVLQFVDTVSRGSFDVIVGMDWLSKRKFVIVCHEKVVRIPLEGDEILRVHGERTQGVVKTLINTKEVDIIKNSYDLVIFRREHQCYLSRRRMALFILGGALSSKRSRCNEINTSKSGNDKGQLKVEWFKQENVERAERLQGGRPTDGKKRRREVYEFWDRSSHIHPQTDGQSERMIQSLEDIMRACVIKFGGSYHLSIQCAPFEALYGRKCRAVVRLPDPKRKTLGEKGIDCIFVRYVEHSKAYRFYVIEPNDSVSINSIIESRDAIFDKNRFSSIPRPKDIIANSDESQRDDHSDDVPSEILEPRKGKRVQKVKSYGSDFQLYLVGGSRDQVGSQYSYCYSIEKDPKTYNEAMQSRDSAFCKEAIDDEIGSIMENNTWVRSDLPPGCRPSCDNRDLSRLWVTYVHDVILEVNDNLILWAYEFGVKYSICSRVVIMEMKNVLHALLRQFLVIQCLAFMRNVAF